MAIHAASPARTPTTRNQIRALLDAPLAPFYFVVASVGFLVGLGTLMVLSSSSVIAQSWGHSPYYFALRQLAFLVIGVIGAYVLGRFNLAALMRLGWLVWALATVLLILVLSPLGVRVAGNQNWLAIGPVQIQPSEFAKLALVVFAATVLHRKRRLLHEPFHLVWPFVPLSVILLFLVLAGRDLGTGIIMGAIFALLLWFVGTPLRYLLPIGAAAAGVVALLVYGSDNRMSRISIFLDPSSNTDLSSQPMSALYALASGGWWGLGLGASRQKWGGLKTGAHTDYIFAVIGEELGLFGVLAVIAAFALLAYAGFEIARRSDTLFGRVAAAGITGWLIVQALINIFVVMHLLPVLGVPLPFVSYGGSALLANLLAVGVLLAVAKQTPEAQRYLRSKKRKNSQRRRMTSVMAATKGDQ
ncbi:putative lipid II flippase FtsW [Tessaracoccus oleiagri]|uniref:Probable peptidoglycan glycosyltransferase FtsW n=1 Tax=Tessaracoccus oleiagri TaxID=686624 RepID=A0A1G9L299_9ACTN|nr:putative lipid II flippase FtsW [Tessaracoccus oleiagri]SDL56108.1 cell division protein FtsW [Tessaracoccus oleiagri]